MTTRNKDGLVTVRLATDCPPLRDGRRMFVDPETGNSYAFDPAGDDDWACCTPSAARIWRAANGFDVVDYEHDAVCDRVLGRSLAAMGAELRLLAPSKTRHVVRVGDVDWVVPARDLCPDCSTPGFHMTIIDGRCTTVVRHDDICPAFSAAENVEEEG